MGDRIEEVGLTAFFGWFMVMSCNAPRSFSLRGLTR